MSNVNLTNFPSRIVSQSTKHSVGVFPPGPSFVYLENAGKRNFVTTVPQVEIMIPVRTPLPSKCLEKLCHLCEVCFSVAVRLALCKQGDQLQREARTSALYGCVLGVTFRYHNE